jgi:hypothetical protein
LATPGGCRSCEQKDLSERDICTKLIIPALLAAVSDIMRFAGAREGMEDPDGFEFELRDRRHTAFASRHLDEIGAD